ncbi:MAG: hypothetical protein V3U03_06510 [Myxococcota bacterium]
MSSAVGWARWLRLLPGLLLAAVALHQVWLARTQGLSAWSGGGFGMFSTVDAGATRHLHAFAIRPGVLRELRPPPSLEKRVLRTLALPSGANLRALALELAELPSPDHGPPHAVHIQVWTTRYDPETLAPSSRILRALEVPLAAD